MWKSYIAVWIAGACMLTGVATAQSSSADSDQAPAQTPAAQAPAPPTPAAAPAPPPAKSVFTQGGMDFSFMFDGYVDGNFNHPNSGFNGLRNFDFRADTVHLNMGMITIDRAAALKGFSRNPEAILTGILDRVEPPR